MAMPNVSPIVKVYYGKPILPEVSRVLACLYEKDFELVAFQNVDCMPIDLIRLQASTSVPTPFFEDGPKFLFESRAICRYISETYADRGNRYLLGRDLLDRVSIEQWLKSEEQSFDPPSRALVLHLAFSLPLSSNKSNNDLLEESERLSQVLDVYNHRLGESRYLAGDEFTLADLTHLPNSRYIATSNEWRHLFDERENVKRWWEDVSRRPSWSKVEKELERSKAEEDEEEEMAEEIEDDVIEITRCVNPKMSLKAGIFQPIEALVQLPVEPKSIFTLSKHVAGPRGSVQVTVPEKMGFSVSVPEQKVTHVETTRIQPHTKQPVADAKIRMGESTIPTARIDKASSEETRVISQSTKPVMDAKVTTEGSDVIPTGDQMPSTAHIDKTRTEQTRALPQSKKPVTDAEVRVEKTSSPPASREVPPSHETTPELAKVTEQYAAYPTDETRKRNSRGFLSQQEPTTGKPEQPTKLSLEGAKAPPTEKTTDRPLTRDQGQTLSPPTAKEVTPTYETTIKSAKVPEKYTASHADEIRSDSRGSRFTQVPVPTSEAVQPMKQRLESPQSPPTEKATTKPPMKDQDQTVTVESKHGQAAEETTNKVKYSASQGDETRRSDSSGLPFTQVPVPTSKTLQPKQSPEGPQSPPTEETATKSPTRDQGQTLITESKHGQAVEEPTNKENEINAEAYLFAKHKEWEEQWKKPEKFGEKYAESIPAQKPQPPKFESTTTPTTQSPPMITSSETAGQEPLPYKTTNKPAKETSESKTTTKPKDMTPPATQANTIPAATQDTVIGEIIEASSASSASNQGSVSQSTSETRNRIIDETSNAPPPKPPKQKGSTTLTPVTTTTSQTAKQEPMTDKSITTPAKEASRSTVPITQEEPSPRTTTTKEQGKTPEVMTQQTTTPDATQRPPPSSTSKTKDVIANKTNNVRSPTTVPPKPMTDKSNNASATETSNSTVPTKERPLASETTIENSGTDQARPYTEQTPPTNETDAKYADVSQSTASSGGNSGIDLEKGPQTDTQMRKLEEKQVFPSEPDTASASDRSTTEPDTAPKQKEAPSETKTEPNKLDTNKPNKPTSQPNKTSDSENPGPVDETIMETTEDEASSVQKPLRGAPSAQTTSSEKGAKQPASLEKATEDQAQDEKSSSVMETAPTSDGRSKALDTTPKQKEPQNETKMETKTGPNQLGTNKPSEFTSVPNSTNDANPMNESLPQTNQNKASPQDNEVISSNKSSLEPLIEQNNKPDSTNNPGAANKE